MTCCPSENRQRFGSVVGRPRPQTARGGHQTGFSLIELLVVIAVVAVLALGGTLGVRALLERGRLSEAVNIVESRVNQARLDAKRFDRTVSVVFDAASSTTFEVGGSVISLPRGVTVAPSMPVVEGSHVMEFSPPFGTWDGVQGTLLVRSGPTDATIHFLGVLAKAVVTR